MAAEAAEQGMTIGQYMEHHLTNLSNHPLGNVVDFSIINYDTIFFSVLLAVLTFWFLWSAAHKMTSGTPGRFQAAVEMLVEFVDNEAKGIIKNANSRKFMAPLGLAVFVWVAFMNGMDLIPVDLLPWLWGHIYSAFGGNPHHAYLRVVPTADVSGSMALSVTVLLLCIYYNLKIKGLGGWIRQLFTAPFGNHIVLYPFNFAMQIVEFVAKTLSHGLRLFGNMYAGELLFMLIALLGGAFSLSVMGFSLAIGQIIAGLAWAIFDILVIILQAFIFMELALIYVGEAHEGH